MREGPDQLPVDVDQVGRVPGRDGREELLLVESAPDDLQLRGRDVALRAVDGPIVVAGSLYLVGAARARLVDDPLLRDPVP